MCTRLRRRRSAHIGGRDDCASLSGMRRENASMDVKPIRVTEIPGLEQLPYAEVWFHELEEARWQEASALARELGKTGLEVCYDEIVLRGPAAA